MVNKQRLSKMVSPSAKCIPKSPCRTSSFIGLEVRIDKRRENEMSPLALLTPVTSPPLVMDKGSAVSIYERKSSLIPSSIKKKREMGKENNPEENNRRTPVVGRRNLSSEILSAALEDPGKSIRKSPMSRSDSGTVYHDAQSSTLVSKSSSKSGNKNPQQKLQYHCGASNIIDFPQVLKTSIANTDRTNFELETKIEESSLSAKSNKSACEENKIMKLSSSVPNSDISIPTSSSNTNLKSSSKLTLNSAMKKGNAARITSTPPPVLVKKNPATPIWVHFQNLFVKKFNICGADTVSTSGSFGTNDMKFIVEPNLNSSAVTTENISCSTDNVDLKAKNKDYTHRTLKSRRTMSTGTNSLQGYLENGQKFSIPSLSSSSDSSIRSDVIREIQSSLKYNDLSPRPDLLDRPTFQDFDGLRNHYGGLGSFAVSSSEGSVQTNINDKVLSSEFQSIYNKSDASNCGSTASNEKGIVGKMNRDVLHTRPAFQNKSNTHRQDQNVDQPELRKDIYFSPVRDSLRKLSHLLPSSDQEIISISQSKSVKKKSEEKRMVNDFLNYSTTEDEFSISTGSNKSFSNLLKSKLQQKSAPNQSANTHQHHRLPSFRSINTGTTEFSKQASTNMSISKSSVASSHRRTNTEFTFTNDCLGHIYGSTSAPLESLTCTTNKSQTPSKESKTNIHNEKTVKKANKRTRWSDMQSPPRDKKNKSISTNINTADRRVLMKSSKTHESVRRLRVPGPPSSKTLFIDGKQSIRLDEYQKGFFFPKSSTFMNVLGSKNDNKNCLFEGWIGFLDGKEIGALSRIKANKLFKREDVRYTMLLQDDVNLILYTFTSPDGGTSSATNENMMSLDFSSTDISIKSIFISKRKGSCLEIKKDKQVLCYVIPINLPRFFFASETHSRLVGQKTFEKLQRIILKKTIGKSGKMSSTSNKKKTLTQQLELEWGDPLYMLKYAPEAQYDSTLNLMIILNVAIKQQHDKMIKPLWEKMNVNKQTLALFD